MTKAGTARSSLVQVRGEVRVADDHDRLVLAPYDRSTAAEFAGSMATGPAGSLLARTAGQVTVAAEAAAALLRLDYPQLDVERLGAPMPGGPGLLGLRWSAFAFRFAANRARARDGRRRLVEGTRALQLGGRSAAEAALADALDAEALAALDDHQTMNVAVMTQPGCPGLAVFDEQGAGKTVTGIFAVDVLAARDQTDVALVVAPKSMVMEWPRDVTRFRGDLHTVGVLAGSRMQRRALLARPPSFLVTSFETVVSMEAELTALAQGGRVTLLVDESFYVKNPDAGRTRALRRLREWCDRAYVLCGTPAPNTAIDLIAQLDLADFGITFWQVPLPRDRGEAHQVVRDVLEDRGFYLRSLKRDVMPDLPPRRFDVVPVDLEGQQLRAYHAALRDLVVDLQAIDDQTFRRRIHSFAERRAALLQLCSNPTRLLPDYTETPGKLQILDRLLPDLVDCGEKVVLWSFYTASLDALVERYSSLGVVRYDGTTSGPDRREAVRSFQETASTRVFIANPAAAGAGLTLHAARYAVFESFSNQAAHYLQSLDRIHRRGQERDVRYVVLLCRDTLEERAYARLREKEEAAQELLGDQVDSPPTRVAMLAELLQEAPAL